MKQGKLRLYPPAGTKRWTKEERGRKRRGKKEGEQKEEREK